MLGAGSILHCTMVMQDYLGILLGIVQSFTLLTSL